MLRLVYIFFIGSISGWVLETIFRRFTKDNTLRKWINPGFLTGPYLPIYGFGCCILFLLAQSEHLLSIENVIVLKLLVVLVMAVCMTVIELIAGLIFIQGMNLKLWDYSNKPFNYKGIICPEFSFYWLLLSAVYYFGLHKLLIYITDILIANQEFLFLLGTIFGIFIVDIGYTVHIAAKIRKFADENNILVRYEELKRNIRKYAEEHKEKYMFFFAFHSKKQLNEHLKTYSEKNEKIQKFKQLINKK